MKMLKSLLLMIAAAGLAPAAPTLTPTPCNLENSLAYQEGRDFECHSLTVPRRHGKPEQGTFQLHVLKIKSHVKPQGTPTVMLNGGPGGSLDGYLGRWLRPDITNPTAPPLWINAFLQHGDVVLYDQRGSGKSEPDTHCQTTIDACIHDLKNRGVDPTSLTTVESVEDLEHLRISLGGEINLYGNSYGSYLAQKYLKYHTEGIQKVILEGVLNASQPQTGDVGTYVKNLVDLCDTSPICKTWYPTLKSDYEALLQEVKTKPWVVQNQGQDITIDPSTLQHILFFEAYNSALELPRIIDQLAIGDLSRISYTAGTYFTVLNPYFSVMHHMMDAHLECAAQPHLPHCNAEPHLFDPLPADYNAPLQTDLPVLVLTGQLDPVTPPSQALGVLPGLRDHLHLLFPAGSHGTYGPPQAFQCAVQVISGFLEVGTQVDHHCMNELPAFNFLPPLY